MADRTILAPEVSGPLAQGRARPVGIAAAAVILPVLWSGFFLFLAVYNLRCTYEEVLDTFQEWSDECHSAMYVLRDLHDRLGYTVAGIFLAFAAPGVVAGVRLLGLRSRGLAFGLGWVGIGIWLLTLVDQLGGPRT